MVSRATTGHKPDGDIKAPPPRLALSILDFCEAHGISEGMFYKLKKQGLTPREMKIGTRTLITFEAAAEWRVQREAAAAAVKVKVKPVPKTPVALPAQREKGRAKSKPTRVRRAEEATT